MQKKITLLFLFYTILLTNQVLASTCSTCCQTKTDASKCENCDTSECSSECGCKSNQISIWYYLAVLGLFLLILLIILVMTRKCKQQNLMDKETEIQVTNTNISEDNTSDLVDNLLDPEAIAKIANSGSQSQSELLQSFGHNYNLMEKVGEGGYAVAYKAYDLDNKDICVIKKMNLETFSEYAKEGAIKEAVMMKKLRCKNIIGFRKVFQIDEFLYIAMDYAEGGSLMNIIVKHKSKNSPIEEKVVWTYFHDLCKGVKFAHDNRIIHRDIKPVNILIHKGVLKLCDFGISKQLNQASVAFTNVWENCAFQAPEMLLDQAKYSYPVDIWGMGITLYLLCTFKYPFANLNRVITMRKIKDDILTGKFAPISNKYSKDMHHMIENTLNVDPDQRYNATQILKFVEKKLKELN